MSTAPLLSLFAATALLACGASGKGAGPDRAASITRPQSDARVPEERGLALAMVQKPLRGPMLQPAPRTTIAVFFASWCGPCRKELGVLAELRARHPALRIIGINSFEEFQDISNQDKLREFLAESAPWLKEVIVADDQLLKDFGGVTKIPTLFVYDEAGKLVRRFRRDKRRPPTLAELDALLLQVGAR